MRSEDATGPVRPPAQPQLEWRDLIGRAPTRRRWAGLPGADRVRMTYSGRGAIYQYLAALRDGGGAGPRRTHVLVPAFHCPTVVDPVLHAGYDVRYYRIERSLEVNAEDFLHKLDDSVAAAIFIRYFGVVASDRALFAPCRAAGAAVIEDCSHAFLAATPLRVADWGADATIYSFWKLLPSRVGGGVLAPGMAAIRGWPPAGAIAARDSLARLRRLAGDLYERPRGAVARALRRAPPHEQPQPVVRKTAAEAYPYDPAPSTWSMPATARAILGNADLESMLDSRRGNYAVLGHGIGASDQLTPMRRSLDPDACPWGFPLLMSRRAERDYLLRASGVPVFSFGEVLHPTVYARARDEPGMVAMAEFLSTSLLAISVHQGLPPAQLASIAGLVNRFIERL